MLLVLSVLSDEMSALLSVKASLSNDSALPPFSKA